MALTARAPVFTALRAGLHALFASLVVLVIGRAVFAPIDATPAVVALALAMLATYGPGVYAARRGRTGRLKLAWLAALTIQWLALLGLTPEAAYLAFPLFFLYLHLLGRWWGSGAVVVATTATVIALGFHGGWSVGGVVGPIVGAGVALLIGLGYQALANEATRREALMQELIAARDQLAATEHESGVLAERARLAREIHDTLAQGLSSIQMLLHAAERADPDRPGVEHLVLARETAAANLADARRFIRELTPPALDDQSLGGALRRHAQQQWAPQGLTVHVRVSDAITLPMHLQTALLRIAQGAIANVIQHARANEATISLTTSGDRLVFTTADAGAGFDVSATPEFGSAPSDSFGLQATRERVEQLGGTLVVESAPGEGTTLTVTLDHAGKP